MTEELGKFKKLSKMQMVNRIKLELGVSVIVATQIYMGLKRVYLKCIENGESFPIPGLGTISLNPYKSLSVMKPFSQTETKRLSKYKVAVKMTAIAKRALRKAT